MKVEGQKNNSMDIDFEKPWNNAIEEGYVGYQIKMLDRTICKQVVRTFEGYAYDGMTRLSNWILEYLAHNEAEITYQKDIERVFDIGKSTIAGSMKVLEKNELVVRRNVEGDARLKQICLTPKGKEYIEKIKQEMQGLESQLTRDLSQDEIEMFFNILQKMKKNITE